MNENIKMLYSLIGKGLCSDIGCSDCHNIFGFEGCPFEGCPIDYANEEQRLTLAKSIVDMVNSFPVSDISLEDIIEILKSK